MLTLVIYNETGEAIDEDALFRCFKRAKRVLASWQGTLQLIFVDDKEMRKLNRQYRGKDAATDVLSFPYIDSHGEDKEPIMPQGSCIGDIFISVETASLQAQEKGLSMMDEVRVLFVHGILHIAGFDHRTDEEEAEMERYASQILHDS